MSRRRTRCVVLGCKRTKAKKTANEEWICGDHWPLTNKKLRRRYFRARKRFKRFKDWRTWKRKQVLWGLLKEQAQQRAMGL